jgi:hypothetical protein
MQWQPTGNLKNARTGHTATLLPSGLVLVSFGDTPSAELYHPDSNEWILTAGSPSLPRSKPTATLLRDGNVLAVGGIIGNPDPELRTEIYDHSTQTWSFTGGHPLSFERNYHATTELADGRVLVVGGWQNAGNLSEIYDPVTQAWTLAGPLNEGRGGHTATLLSDGRVLVVGGAWQGQGFARNAELFDPATPTEKWTLVGGRTVSQYQFRSEHTATRLQDGKVLVVGGREEGAFLSSCEVFDPDTGAWSDVGSLNEARTGHSAVLLYTGNVLVVGGYSQASDLQSTEFFNPETARWTLGPPMSVPRYDHTATLLRRDLHGPLEMKVLVAGGRNYSTTFALDSAELLTIGAVNV